MMRDDILVRPILSVGMTVLIRSSQAFLKSGRPLLLRNGLAIAMVDELAANAERELIDAGAQTYIRVQNVYARRRAY